MSRGQPWSSTSGRQRQAGRTEGWSGGGRIPPQKRLTPHVHVIPGYSHDNLGCDGCEHTMSAEAGSCTGQISTAVNGTQSPLRESSRQLGSTSAQSSNRLRPRLNLMDSHAFFGGRQPDEGSKTQSFAAMQAPASSAPQFTASGAATEELCASSELSAGPSSARVARSRSRSADAPLAPPLEGPAAEGGGVGCPQANIPSATISANEGVLRREARSRMPRHDSRNGPPSIPGDRGHDGGPSGSPPRRGATDTMRRAGAGERRR